MNNLEAGGRGDPAKELHDKCFPIAHNQQKTGR